MGRRHKETWREIMLADQGECEDDEDILAFVSSEQERLSERLTGFSISWMEDERKVRLELWSETIRPSREEFYASSFSILGRGFTLGHVPLVDSSGSTTIPDVQRAGRLFYYQYRDQILHLKRDLSWRE